MKAFAVLLKKRGETYCASLMLIFLIVFGPFDGLFAQVPRYFNYQAVLRDAEGDLVKDHGLDVRLSLLLGSSEGEEVWSETQGVTTNSEGLFSLQAGKEVPLEVDWTKGPYWLKVEIDMHDGQGFRLLGSQQLVSVPYALMADRVSDLDHLRIRGKDLETDSALFEVKRKDGQTVFAVYNEGVRIYVDTATIGKGSFRSGFAIGGFGMTKGEPVEFFRVTPDSTRVYVRESSSKRPYRGGFAIGGYGMTKGESYKFVDFTSDNYFIGYLAGSNVTTGKYNSFLGYQAGYSLTTGMNSLFLGYEAGYKSSTTSFNVFIGNRAGYHTQAYFPYGSFNIFLGDSAGFSNTSGYGNTFIGLKSGKSNTTGSENTFVGPVTGMRLTGGSYNILLGSGAGANLTTGNKNILIGWMCGGYQDRDITGDNNIAIGTTFIYNTTGSRNVFVGNSAGIFNNKGSYNVMVGESAGRLNVNGNFNTCVGYRAGGRNNGSNNVFIGASAGYGGTNWNKKLVIEGDGGNYTSPSSVLIYGDFAARTLTFNGKVGIGTTTPSYPLYVAASVMSGTYTYGYLNSNGDVGKATSHGYISIYATGRVRAAEFNAASDARIKHVVGRTNPERDLEILRRIRVTDYRYIDTIGKGSGLHKKVIAQELQEVYPEAVHQSRGFIPSVYCSADRLSYDWEAGLMTVHVPRDHGLHEGEKVRLILPGEIIDRKVEEVVSGQIFRVTASRPWKTVFVFGKEVDDFLTVDYEAVAMLNVSATQELALRNEVLQMKVEMLAREVARLKKENEHLAALDRQQEKKSQQEELRALRERLDKLEALVRATALK